MHQNPTTAEERDSIQFFIIDVLSQQLQGQTQHKDNCHIIIIIIIIILYID
jgi:hypothetical protein